MEKKRVEVRETPVIGGKALELGKSKILSRYNMSQVVSDLCTNSAALKRWSVRALCAKHQPHAKSEGARSLFLTPPLGGPSTKRPYRKPRRSCR